MIRDPVERFLSAYEMAVETATVDVVKKFKMATAGAQRPGDKSRRERASSDTKTRRAIPQPTTSVWPWSIITKALAEDMTERLGG